jgi:hypothetical protein
VKSLRTATPSPQYLDGLDPLRYAKEEGLESLVELMRRYVERGVMEVRVYIGDLDTTLYDFDML